MKRAWLKHGIKVLLDANLNPSTVVIIVIKKPVLILLDKWIPDSPDDKK